MRSRVSADGTKSTVWIQDEMKTPASIRAARFMDDYFRTINWKNVDLWPRWMWTKSQLGPPATTAVKMQERGRGKGRFYDARIRVRENAVFPFKASLATGACSVRDRAVQILTGRKFWYEYTEVVFADPAEVLVYFTFVTIFKVLRFIDAVPGRATRVGAAKFGLEMLKQFRIVDAVKETVHA